MLALTALLRLTVDEGQIYRVGNFDIQGNRRFSSEELRNYYPFIGHEPFSQGAWESSTEKVSNLYANNGYIYAHIEPSETRRTGADGNQYLDLSWTIREGAPATINKIEILGNDITHGTRPGQVPSAGPPG